MYGLSVHLYQFRLLHGTQAKLPRVLGLFSSPSGSDSHLLGPLQDDMGNESQNAELRAL
jgi:hypothetical protein